MKQSFNVDNIRQTFDMRLGEIIENIIGDKRVRELFDSRGGVHPEEYEGKPTGLIALDLGVITQETKTALLVAQAAERTLQLADKTLELTQNRAARVNAKQTINRGDEQVKYISFDDPVFKYVGSDRDPKALQQAQATWQIAQINYNQEIDALNDSINNPGAEINHRGIGEEAAHGLKLAAKKHYAQAAQMLEKEGHSEAADKLKAVHESIQVDETKATYAPAGIASKIRRNENRSCQDANIILNDDKWSINDNFEKTLIRLQNLTATPKDEDSPDNKPSQDMV
jgi:hypothetical protein